MNMQTDPTFISQILVTRGEPSSSELLTHLSTELRLKQPLQPSQTLFVNQPDETLTIAQVRTLQTQLSFAYKEHSPHIFFIFNADTASAAAQNALLKSCEEPPAHTCLVLVVHDAARLLPTLLSRCQISLLKTNPQKLDQEADTAVIFPTSLSQLWREIDSLSDRSAAQKWCQALFTTALKEFEHNPTTENLKLVTATTAAMADLESNLHVKLTLEHHFLPLLINQN